MISLLPIIQSADPVVRNESLDAQCRDASVADLLAATRELDAFRRDAPNLYERVRALFFLASIHRFHLPARLAATAGGPAPTPPSAKPAAD